MQSLSFLICKGIDISIYSTDTTEGLEGLSDS